MSCKPGIHVRLPCRLAGLVPFYQDGLGLDFLVDAVWYFMEEAPQSFSPALQYNQPTVRSARGPA